MKRAMTGLLSGLFLLGMVSQVQAISTTYNIVDGLFEDGGTINGSITLDVGPGIGGANRLIDFNLTTSAFGAFSGFNYTPGTTDAPPTRSFNGRVRLQTNTLQPAGANFRRLVLRFNPNLNTNAALSGSPLLLGGNSRERINFPGGPSTNFTRDAVSGGGGGSAVATPEPGTILLFGSGLLGLGLWRYRRNLKS